MHDANRLGLLRQWFWAWKVCAWHSCRDQSWSAAVALGSLPQDVKTLFASALVSLSNVWFLEGPNALLNLASSGDIQSVAQINGLNELMYKQCNQDCTVDDKMRSCQFVKNGRQCNSIRMYGRTGKYCKVHKGGKEH